MTVIMIISFSLVLSWWLNFNWWHLIKPTKFVNPCLVAHLSLPLLWIGIDTTSPKKATRAHLLCSVKHVQRVRRSFPPVIEMVTLQRDHFSHYKSIACTPLSWLFMDLCHARARFTHQEMSSVAPVSLLPAAGDKWTMHHSSCREVTPLFYVTDPKDLFYFPTETPSEHRWIINSW